jgi:hypothetical protein
VAFFLATGKQPIGLVLHRCDSRKCVSPEHLFDGTSQDNSTDMVRKRRQSHGEKHRRAIMPNRPRGQGHANSILTESRVKQMRELKHLGQRKLSKMFGVSKYCAYSVISRLAWKHIP